MPRTGPVAACINTGIVSTFVAGSFEKPEYEQKPKISRLPTSQAGPLTHAA